MRRSGRPSPTSARRPPRPASPCRSWNLIGLSVKPDRLTQVHVDGGGEISADAGTGETCLDVEQSGGLAPGAKVIVYDAPNSDAGFIDVFYRAASDNLVDTMSCSWGEAEEFFFPEVIGVDARPQLIAFHQALLEAAAQGISVFAASGTGPVDLLDLPGNFPGRNVPDVSLDADPFSGYLLFSTPDGGLLSGFGGTSFVAPQLNGIMALVAQANGVRRLGLINPMLYRFKRQVGAGAPLVDITAGDNWFYAGIPGFEPGAGLGVLNVANFSAAVGREMRGH